MNRLRLIAAAVLPVALVALTGCGSSVEAKLPATQPVKGKIVTAGGQPLSGGRVTLILVTNTDKYGPNEAPADVKPDGTFEPFLFGGQPGLYPGKWKVVVSPHYFKDGKALRAREPVPAKYQSADTTDLTIDVAEGDNTPTVTLK